MSSIISDTLEFANKLKAGGFTELQAETLARAIAEIVERQWVNRQDFEQHQTDIKRDIHTSENRLEIRIKELETTLSKDIEVLRAETKTHIAETKAELGRWRRAAANRVGRRFAAKAGRARLTGRSATGLEWPNSTIPRSGGEFRRRPGRPGIPANVWECRPSRSAPRPTSRPARPWYRHRRLD